MGSEKFWCSLLHDVLVVGCRAQQVSKTVYALGERRALGVRSRCETTPGVLAQPAQMLALKQATACGGTPTSKNAAKERSGCFRSEGSLWLEANKQAQWMGK